MKKAFTSIKNIFINIDDRFDIVCLKLERKVCNGNTVDEQLAKSSAKVKNVVMDKVVPAARAKSPFQKEVKPQSIPVVKAIPLTQVCTHCSEVIPVEAIFCPICSKQMSIPMASCNPALPNQAKVVGLPPVPMRGPAKRTISSRIKDVLAKDVLKLRTPMANIKKGLQFNN